MYTLSGTTITLPKGDTGLLKFGISVINSATGGSEIDESRDKCVWSLVQDGEEVNGTVQTLNIVDGSAVLPFKNVDTDDMEAGDYNWNFRIVISPVWDNSATPHRIIDGAEVHSPFAVGGKLPKLKLVEVGTYV